MDLEVVLTGHRVSQVTDGTGVEWNGGATPRADEMMAVRWAAGDINRATRTIQNPGKHAERGEDFQGSIDRRAAAFAGSDCRVGDELLGRKRPLLS